MNINIEKYKQLVKNHKWQVLLSTSRRTPKEIEEYIADIVKERNDDFPVNLFSHQQFVHNSK